MVDVERIHEWRGEDVYDERGEKVGRLYEVFYDRANDEAVLGLVRSGLLGRRCYLVPLGGASAGRGYLKVAYPAERIRQAKGDRSAETLEPSAVRAAGEVYGTQLAVSAPLESQALIERRQVELEEKRQRADELEAEALRRAEEVKQAHARADQAAREADAAAREGEDARRAALEARRQAETAQAGERAAPVEENPD